MKRPGHDATSTADTRSDDAKEISHAMTVRRLSAATATGSALVLLLAACSGSSMSGMGMSPGQSMSPTPGAAPSAARAADIAFAQQMIPHHEQAVQMADIALDRPVSAQITTLAKQIKASKGREVAAMRSWLQQWGASETMSGTSDGSMGGMDMGAMPTSGMMSDTDMAKLRQASGRSFEQMWLKMMIACYRGAGAVAKQALSSTTDPKVSKLAQEIAADTAQVAGMQRLLAG